MERQDEPIQCFKFVAIDDAGRFVSIFNGTTEYKVGETVSQEVRAGQLCVVRSGPEGTHTYRLLPADAARRVHHARPDAIAFAPLGVLS